MINLKEITISNPENNKSYPYVTPLFQKGFTIKLESHITMIVGDNGIGKSTLLEALAINIGFPSIGGDANHHLMANNLNKVIYNGTAFSQRKIETADFIQDNTACGYELDNLTLANNLKLKWFYRTKKGMFIRSETFANIISYEKFGAKKLSHGEGILKILCDIKSDGLYILDEPEAGLSPIKILSLINILKEKSETYGTQFIIATHNPILMCCPNSMLYQITETNLQIINPEESEHFIMTKRILNNKDDFFNKYFN